MHSLEVKGGEIPKKLVITGEIVSEFTNLDFTLAQYTMKLQASPYFASVDSSTAERDIYSPVPKANFEITCGMKL